MPEPLPLLVEDNADDIAPAERALTSKEPSDIGRSYRLGANRFVTKPFDFKKFPKVFASMPAYWLSVNETI